MRPNLRGLIALLPLLALVTPLAAQDDSTAPTWEESVQAWKEHRAERLRQPDGWLSLVALLWLDDGTNTFGSAADNDLVLPAGPEHGGRIVVENGAARLESADAAVTHDGEPVTTLALAPDSAEAGPTVVQIGRLSAYVIDRTGHLALRVKDPESPALLHFQGLEYFPLDPSWHFPQARFEAYDPVKTIPVADIAGLVSDSPVWGAVVFERDGTTYRLDALAEPGDEELFLIFGDRTNGTETYGGGRYLYTDAPDAEGHVDLDFNVSYSPPCIFTPFATCPLPPPQNRLPVRVEAGEKAYAGGH